MLTDIILGMLGRAVFVATARIDSYYRRDEYLDACRAYNDLHRAREANRKDEPWAA